MSQFVATVFIAITWTVMSTELVTNIHTHSNPDTQLKACLTNHISDCYVHCDYHNCRYYKWLITDQTYNISSININCEDPSSCYGLELHILDSIYTININEITINCGPNSCEGLSLNLYPSSLYNDNYFNPLETRKYNIHCDSVKSCDTLRINQLSTSLTVEEHVETNMNEVNVHCIGKYSCDNAIISNSDDTILNLYAYSRRSFGADSIVIITNEYDTVNLYCHDNDEENTNNLIQFDTNSPLKNVADLLYITANKPCQDIVILAEDHEECMIDYIVSDHYNFMDMIMAQTDDVFDLDINELYNIECVPNSRNNDHTFIIPYNISLNINENECKKYFDKDTVNKNLEGLFSAALINYMNDNANEIITDIKRVRVNGNYNCDAGKLSEYQQINVKFDIKSTDIGRDMVEMVFNTNSMFYEQSMKIIDNYFGSVITLAGMDGTRVNNGTLDEQFCVL